MPELPEVETVARGLREVLPGRRIVSVRLGKTDFIDDPALLEHDLPGSTIARIRRLGKFLLLDLEPKGTPPEEGSLLIHLGMTGKITVSPPEAPVPLHTHVFLGLDDGRELRYNDVRRFGRMALLANAAHESVLGDLGLEPLEATEEEFRARIQSRSAHIKALLLDQRVLRGIGNIYADERFTRESSALNCRRMNYAAYIAPYGIFCSKPFGCEARRFRTMWTPLGKWGNISCGIASISGRERSASAVAP